MVPIKSRPPDLRQLGCVRQLVTEARSGFAPITRVDDPAKIQPWFLRDSPGFAIVPELAWQIGRPVRYGAGELRGFEERAGKSLILQDSDNDMALADQIVGRLSELHEKVPGLAILPAHGRSAYKKFFPGGPLSCISGQ